MAKEAIQSSFGIMRWPHLVTPRTPDGGGDPKFAATFVAAGTRQGDAEFLQALQRQMDETCTEQWNTGIEGMRQRVAQQNKAFNLALKRNADPARAKHAGIGEHPQGFHFEAKTKFNPDFFDAQGNKLPQADPSLFYDGAVVRVWVSSYTYDHPKSGPGVGLNLNGVQFVQHGPKLGGVPIDAKPVDPNEVPADLPTAAAPNAAPQGGQEQAPAPAPGASYYPPQGQPDPNQQQGPQGQPPAGPGGFGF